MDALPHCEGSPQAPSGEIQALVPQGAGAALQTLLDEGPAGIVLLDADLRCVHCNDAAGRIAGKSVDAMRGQPARVALGRLWSGLQPACAHVLDCGLPVMGIELSEPNGDAFEPAPRVWTVSLHPVRLQGAEALHGIGLFFSEVTPYLLRAQELERAREAAQEKSDAKDRFLAMLSHELRTPLTPVMLAVQALERDPALPASVRRVLAMVHRNLRLEVALIDDLLELNRITHGKVALRLGPMDVHEAVHHALQICDAEARSRGVGVQLRMNAGSTLVTADAMRVQQILWNLLKNSIKFSLPGGRVECETRNEGEAIVVDVTDHGIGIDPDTLPLLFQAFEQGSLPSGYRGTGLGLGLALARSLAQMHGGSLTAASAGLQQGATFSLRLPLAAPGTRPQRDERDVPSPCPLSGTSPSILLVEDHEDSASMLSAMLSLRGWDVHVAASAAQALELAGARRFDLLIGDLSLPDGSGIELLRRLRALQPRGTAALQAIALSSFGTPADVEQSLAAGYFAHLVKPLDIEALFEAICGAFDAEERT